LRAVSGPGLGWLPALAGKGRVEGAGELGVAVADQEAGGADPVTEIHDQAGGLAGLCRRARRIRRAVASLMR
jgi:hypothetical protein